MNNVDLPFVFIDSKNIIVYANNSFFNLTGYDYNIMNSLNIEKIIDFNNNILILSNNEKIPVNYEIYPIKNSKVEADKVILLNSLKPLIDAKIKETSFREYSDKFTQFITLFQFLIDNYPKSLVFFDNNGRIKKCNKKFKDFLLRFYNGNFKEDNLSYNYITEILKDLFLEKNLSLNEFISRINNKEIVINEYYYYFKHISLLNYEIFDFENLLIISDNTDFNRIKKESEKQHNLDKKLFEKINIPLCTVDQDGFIKNINLCFSENFKNYQKKNIFSLNNALYNILRKNEKLIFNNETVYLGDYIIEIDRFIIREKINYKDLQKVKIESSKLKVYSIYCQSFFTYFNSLSNKIDDNAFIFIFIDKTDLLVKKIETKKLLEDSNNISRRLDLLINNLNHEIRTPINIILGYIELMKYENLDEFAISKLNEIIFYIDNINIIIKDIISISSYVNDEKNIVELNLKPTLIDFKNFIDRSCLFSCNIDIPEEEKIIVKINLLIFKNLFYFIIDNYKNISTLQFNIKIVTLKNYTHKKSATLILSIREKDKIDFHIANEISQTTRIVLEHLVFVLNGQIRFYSSICNFDIKIPIDILI